MPRCWTRWPSEGRYRGVALLGADATPRRYARCTTPARGRFNFVPHLGGAPDPAVFDHVVGLIAPLGWHLCLHLDGAQLPGCCRACARCRCPS